MKSQLEHWNPYSMNVSVATLFLNNALDGKGQVSLTEVVVLDPLSSVSVRRTEPMKERSVDEGWSVDITTIALDIVDISTKPTSAVQKSSRRAKQAAVYPGIP